MELWCGTVNELRIDEGSAHIFLERPDGSTNSFTLYEDAGASPVNQAEMMRRGALLAVAQRAFGGGLFLSAYCESGKPVTKLSLRLTIEENQADVRFIGGVAELRIQRDPLNP